MSYTGVVLDAVAVHAGSRTAGAGLTIARSEVRSLPGPPVVATISASLGVGLWRRAAADAELTGPHDAAAVEAVATMADHYADALDAARTLAAELGHTLAPTYGAEPGEVTRRGRRALSAQDRDSGLVVALRGVVMVAAVGRRIVLILVVMVLLLAVMGCGDDDDATATGDVTTTEGGVAATTVLPTTTVLPIGPPCFGLVETDTPFLPGDDDISSDMAVCEVDAGALLVRADGSNSAEAIFDGEGWSSLGMGRLDDCSNPSTDDWPQELIPADDQGWNCVEILEDDRGSTMSFLSMEGLEPF